MTTHRRFAYLISLALSLCLAPAMAFADDLPPPDEAPADPEQTDVVAPAPEDQLAAEIDRVRELTAKLKAIESAPLPTAPELAAAAAAAVPASAPKPPEEIIPTTPVTGAGEEMADALYALGKYKDALALYAKLVESKPKEETAVWALMQSGHCARHLRDYVSAVALFEQIMNEYTTSPWVRDAEWWAAQIKWRLLWDETMRQQGTVATAAPAPK